MFGAMIDYRYFTGDSSYNTVIEQAMLHQAGPDWDFMPPNQTRTEGNDDQGFWAMAAMSAAENNHPNPPKDQPQWLGLAQAVFETQVRRWDNATCGGGLRWQIFTFNGGYNYKNTISNGCFFNLASRLAVYTGNATYALWAETVFDWMHNRIGLIDKDYNFFDGSDVLLQCKEFDHLQWTYNAGVYLAGAANMYNFTSGSQVWEERVRGIVANLKHFMPGNDNIIVETACEPVGTCNVDQRSFKAYLARWMAMAAVKAPLIAPEIKPILRANAEAAVKTCTGGQDGNQCGLKWTTGAFDGSTGVGEQMAALEIFQANLIDTVAGPVTAESGGTSLGDPNAGRTSKVGPNDLHRSKVTTGDKIGGAALTVGVCALFIGGGTWLGMG